MEIFNVQIKNVTVGFDDRDRLSASMGFSSRHNGCSWGFILTDPTDSQRLAKLMKYAGASNVNQLNGKIIRIIIYNNFIAGFAHPIENKVVPVQGAELMELTEEQFAELLKNK